MITTNKTSKDLKQIIAENQTFIFNIHAAYCGACEMVGEQLKELSEIDPSIAIFRSEADDEQDFIIENKIAGTPQIYIYHEGKVVFSHNGFIPKEALMEELKKWKA